MLLAAANDRNFLIFSTLMNFNHKECFFLIHQLIEFNCRVHVPHPYLLQLEKNHPHKTIVTSQQF